MSIVDWPISHRRLTVQRRQELKKKSRKLSSRAVESRINVACWTSEIWLVNRLTLSQIKETINLAIIQSLPDFLQEPSSDADIELIEG